MAAPSSELERWLLADRWAIECVGPRGARILAVGPDGFRWDADGLFAPQWCTWDRARRELAWRARRAERLEGDYGGAFDGVGTVYSDADPGL